jgi:hypothetical protein
VGHEFETWLDIESLASLIGYTDFHEDGSGPWEMRSVPADHKLPWPIVLAGVYEFSYSFIYNDEYDETAGQHIHISLRSRRELVEFGRFAHQHLPLLQHLFSVNTAITSEGVYAEFSYRRDYWARDCYNDNYEERHYCAVTLNAEEEHKPLTLEFRLCETWPLKCVAGVVILYAMFKENLYIKHTYELYDESKPIKYMPILTNLNVPAWVKEIYKLSFKTEIQSLEDLPRKHVFKKLLLNSLEKAAEYNNLYETSHYIALDGSGVVEVLRPSVSKLLAKIKEVDESAYKTLKNFIAEKVEARAVAVAQT